MQPDMMSDLTPAIGPRTKIPAQSGFFSLSCCSSSLRLLPSAFGQSHSAYNHTTHRAINEHRTAPCLPREAQPPGPLTDQHCEKYPPAENPLRKGNPSPLAILILARLRPWTQGNSFRLVESH